MASVFWLVVACFLGLGMSVFRLSVFSSAREKNNCPVLNREHFCRHSLCLNARGRVEIGRRLVNKNELFVFVPVKGTLTSDMRRHV